MGRGRQRGRNVKGRKKEEGEKGRVREERRICGSIAPEFSGVQHVCAMNAVATEIKKKKAN